MSVRVFTRTRVVVRKPALVIEHVTWPYSGGGFGHRSTVRPRWVIRCGVAPTPAAGCAVGNPPTDESPPCRLAASRGAFVPMILSGGLHVRLYDTTFCGATNRPRRVASGGAR